MMQREQAGAAIGRLPGAALGEATRGPLWCRLDAIGLRQSLRALTLQPGFGQLRILLDRRVESLEVQPARFGLGERDGHVFQEVGDHEARSEILRQHARPHRV